MKATCLIAGLMYSTSIFAQQTPQLIKDIHPTGSSNPKELTILNPSQLFFTAFNPDFGEELYVSTGDVGSATLVKDISPGQRSSSPHNLTPFKGKLYFFADDMFTDLWVSSGTAQSTQKVFDWPANGPHGLDRLLTNVDDKLLFFIGGNSPSGSLWISDGTEAGTKKIHELNPDNYYSAGLDDFEVTYARSFNGKFVFVLNDGTHGFEVWASDGTTAGTKLLKDISDVDAYRPHSFVELNGSLYFIHYNSNTGFEVYKTDGTQEGTSLAFEIVGGPGSTSPEYLQVSNGFLWFGYYDDDEEKMTLARSSGSGASIIMAYEEDDAPKRFTDLGLKTLFTKYDRAQGNGLWITEGFASSTRIIKVVNILDSKCSGCPFPKDGGYVYFPAQTYYSGIELWRSNGTEFGTQQIINLNPGEANSNPKEITPNGNGVFFVADDGKHGYELWKSNLGVVGLEEEEHIQVAFEIFPNPTGGIIQLNSEEPLAGIWITDVLGKVIFQENNPSPSSSHSLDLSQYSNGLYILTVVSQSGGKNSKRLMLDK